jgi:hypothetical protein
LLTVLIALVGFIGHGFSKRIEIVFAEFKKYQTKEICQIYREGQRTERKKTQTDLNKLGQKVDNIKKG